MAVSFFGVRHHSPTAARLVAELIEATRPGAVLVEGPTHFNDRLDELLLDHRLPIMIYQWAPLRPDADEGTPEWGARRAVFYPLCDYSPEWTALRAANAAGAEIAFIDLPWLGLTGDDTTEAENQFAEPEPGTHGEGLKALLAATGTETVDAMHDELIEVDDTLTLAGYLTRIEIVGEVMRGTPSHETRQRELHMAERIRDAATRHDDVLVVCGAAHVSGLRELLDGPPQPAPDMPSIDPGDERYGIALTPTSYAALDALDGYNAGQPNPGFYHEVFHDRAEGKGDTAERLLRVVAAGLRERRQSVSAADLIATHITARALAGLRGHRHIWRTDLLDGVTSALVKDDAGDRHPLLDAVHDILRGDRLGALAPEAVRPPLVQELVASLTRLGLLPDPGQRPHDADLTTARGLEESRLLHSVVELEVEGFTLVAPLDDRGIERWSLRWSPGYEATLVAAARFGGTRAEAVSARLLSLAAEAGRGPREAAALLMRAALCGVDDLSGRFRQRAEEIIAESGDLPGVGEALTLLMRLYRYDPLLGAGGDAGIGRLAAVAFDRVLRLTERLAPMAGGPGLEGTIAAIRAATDAAERVGAELGLDLEGWDAAMAGVFADDTQAAELRGTALGARWLTGVLPDEDLADAIGLAATPMGLGEIVAGLLGIAREAALRRRDLLLRLDGIIAGYSQDDFFDAVPGLRRAFRGYTPRERSLVADILLGRDSLAALARFTASEDVALEIARFESDVFATVGRFLGESWTRS